MEAKAEGVMQLLMDMMRGMAPSAAALKGNDFAEKLALRLSAFVPTEVLHTGGKLQGAPAVSARLHGLAKAVKEGTAVSLEDAQPCQVFAYLLPEADRPALTELIDAVVKANSTIVLAANAAAGGRKKATQKSGGGSVGTKPSDFATSTAGLFD